MQKRVCVFGSYKDLGKKEKENIIKLGRLLAEKGFEVVSGGFSGTMEDISRGAKEAGGKTLGITFYKWKDAFFKEPMGRRFATTTTNQRTCYLDIKRHRHSS